MQLLSDFSLRQEHSNLTEMPRHELMYQGKGTGFYTEASDVVAQYRYGSYFIVATVLENPKKEKLECFVLDQSFRKKAYRQYSGWFTTAFMVTGQKVLSDTELEIQLNKTIRIHLKVTESWLPWRRVRLELQPLL